MTFRDPESARRACADPAPIIDGRRANCNLASLGRPRPSMSYGIYLIFLNILNVRVIYVCRVLFVCWTVDPQGGKRIVPPSGLHACLVLEQAKVDLLSLGHGACCSYVLPHVYIRLISFFCFFDAPHSTSSEYKLFFPFLLVLFL